MKSAAKSIVLLLAIVLGGAHFALAQAPTQAAARPGVQQGRIQLLGADMAGICKPGDIERAHRLADACEGRQQCSFVPEAGDAAAEACARESMALWDCGDGQTRYAALGAQGAGQSREIRLECPRQAVAAAPPPAPAPAPKPVTTATAEPARRGQPETVKVEDVQAVPKLVISEANEQPALDLSEAGIDQEQLRATCAVFVDPFAPEDPRRSLAKLHADIYKAPDHGAGAAAPGCDMKTAMPASARPSP